MPRAKRREFQGAIYLATLREDSGAVVFYDPQLFKRFADNPRAHAPDARQFESLLWETCTQYDARIHAYLIEPCGSSIVIQTLGAPLGWIMHDLLTRYSIYLREQGRIPRGTKLFPRRYRAQIVQPEKLPYVVRYVQRHEAPGDRPRRAINHPFNSHLIYCGRRPQPQCFVTSATQAALKTLGYQGASSYFQFMAARDSPSIAHMLSRSVIGEEAFAKAVRDRCREPRIVPSREDILQQVTSALLHAASGLASSSTHRGALARALVAWYAMRAGTAQIGSVAKWFGVTSSDLRYLIRRHRERQPHYFSKPLPELFAQPPARDGASVPTTDCPPGPPSRHHSSPPSDV